jgi:hypothetical protein
MFRTASSYSDLGYKIFPHTTTPKIISNTKEIKSIIDEIINDILNFIADKISKTGEDYTMIWDSVAIQQFILHTFKYNPLQIKSYLPLPKELQNKKCCINIQNDDDKCFKYCILYHIYKNELISHPERQSKCKKYKDTEIYKLLDTLKYPVAIKDIRKIEDILGFAINIYGDDKTSVRITNKCYKNDDKYINLVVVGDHIENVKVNHYVYIHKFDIFATDNKFTNGKHTTHQKFICFRCLHPFSRRERLECHKPDCDIFEPTKIDLPKIINDVIHTIKFGNFTLKFKAPVVIYADFETFVKPTGNIHDNSQSNTTLITEMPPCSYSFNVVSDHPQLNLGLFSFRGENAVEQFLNSTLGENSLARMDRNMR